MSHTNNERELNAPFLNSNEMELEEEEVVLIDSLEEYIEWYGVRESKTDKFAERQPRSVALAMLLLEEIKLQGK